MFPPVNPRQSFPALEQEMLAYWKANNTFQKSLEIRKDAPEFNFYDGPPFATGTPHYGHLLAGTIKDVIPRYQTMKGKYVERRFGWDCHGLPIENLVEKKLGISGKKDIEDKIGVFEFNEQCRANVFGYVDVWRSTVERMGRWVDMDNDYKTMDVDFMESVWWVFSEIYKKGLIYESYRVVPYCPRCSTPLSNFEVNQGYEDKQDKAVTVKFKVKGTASKYVLAWTTTPWTLPANLGLAVGNDIIYAEILDKASGDTYVLATERIATYYKNLEDYTLVREYPGSCLVGLEYEAVFDDFMTLRDAGSLPKDITLGTKAYHVVAGHHVTTDSGTGVVHIAPAYGEDDFQIGVREDLGFISHIDATGNVTWLLSDNGTYVFDYNQIVIDRLKNEKKIVHVGTIDHSYPHCYRCKTPLIYRAISAWYVNVESIKDKMVANNEQITWVPETIKHGRFGKWVEGARDWNISRNRYWGSAIPVWKSEDGDIIVIGSVKELYEGNKAFGDIIETDGKYTFKDGSAIDIHKHYVDNIKIEKDGKTYTRIPEVLDCWFESGSMPYASKHYPFEDGTFKFPADFIAEGLDQTRGWFYTLLILGTALFDNTPFMNVIVNGLILAEDGKKMSKSLNNYPDPMGLIEQHGADALRFFMLSSQVVKGEDLRFSEAWVEETVKKVILPLWNTYSFFTTYANIDAWSPSNTAMYFVRHGETDTNHEGRLSDGTDNTKLNTHGRSQAKATGERLKHAEQKFDIIISSSLDRALETAEIIASEIGHVEKIILDDSLIERCAPKYSGKFHTDIVKEHFERTGEVVEIRHSSRIWSKDDSAETIDGFCERISTWYDRILQEFPGKRILVVSHGGVFRALNKHVQGISYEDSFHGTKNLVNAEVAEVPAYVRSNPLDRFIIGELQTLIAKTTDALDTYDLQRGARAITDFMDDLTNWYVRRSRRRFWESGLTSDKLAAYETLHRVLVDLTRVMAPFCPFISESVYRSLTGHESVHLDIYPEFERTWVSQLLLVDMKRTKDLVTLGLALRGREKIRVRQPLARAIIGEHLEEYYLGILQDELNIKEVTIADMSTIARKICKPNARLIGAKFGKAVQDVIREAKTGNFTELENGGIQVGAFTLEPGEFEIAYEPLENVTGLSVEGGFGTVIAIDTTVTEDLKLEGYARDIVRQIQDTRKEAGYEVSDRIRLSLSWVGMEELLAQFGEYIASETLSTVDRGLTSGDIEKEIELEGVKVKILLNK